MVRSLSDFASCNSSREQIMRALRLAPFIIGKPRFILVKFQSFKAIESVLKVKSKLKTSPISVSEDFSFSTHLTRRKLLEYRKVHENVFKQGYEKHFC